MEENEVFELPVMVPGNFPVSVPIQVSTIEDIEKELQIMDHELEELEQAEKDILSDLEDDLFIQEMEAEQEKPIEKPVNKTVFKCLMTGDKYKEIFGALNAICSEIVLHIREDGITAAQVDTANVSLVAIDYKPDNFELYKPIEPVNIGVDIPDLWKLRTMIKKGSMVLLEIEKIAEDDYKINVSIEGTTTQLNDLAINTIRKEPNTSLIDNFKYNSKIELKADDVIQGIKEGSKISDRVRFIVDNGNFNMLFEGATSVMNKSVPVMSYNSINPVCKSLFTIDYLKDMVKVMNKKEIISLDIGQDLPVILNRDSCKFMLAPRIEGD